VVPAAAVTVDHLAAYADFLSVGTNDLIRIPRRSIATGRAPGGYYEPRTPAVLRLLRAISIAGRRAKCDLSVCGEMAADPLLVGLLVGLGFRTFSMTPAAIPSSSAASPRDGRQAADAARRRLRARSVDGGRRAGANGRRHASSRRGRIRGTGTPE
jgi:phosphotransferase system enzyme I (PtsI)